MTSNCHNDFCPIEVVNISVVNGPILKDYYYKSLNIAGINKILLQIPADHEETVHLRIPPMPVNSPHMKIIFHMLNHEPRTISWSLKRMQLCNCVIVQKSVGINTFRNVFNCPHRELLTILPTSGEVKGGTVFSFTLNISYGCPGNTELGYEFDINNEYKLQMRFLFDVYEFHPCKCILTKSLLPVCIFKNNLAIQSIWIHNPLNHDLTFKISTDNRNLRVVEENIYVASGTTHPILVQFTPNCLGDYELTFRLEFMGIEVSFQVKATAVNLFIPVPAQHCSKVDFECPEAPFTIYKNHLAIAMGTRGTITKMVILHNSSDACVQFLWKTNELKGYYRVEITPTSGTCKPKHSVLCTINITAGSIQSVFGEIPIVCEIHSFTGKELGVPEECSYHSSLDEKRETNTLLTRLMLNLCLRVHALRSLDIPMVTSDPSEKLVACVKKKFSSGHFDRDIFDKLLWNFVYNEDFLNDIVRKRCDKTYGDTIKGNESISSRKRINKSIFVEVVLTLTRHAIEELSHNWRFIPQELAISLK